MPGGYFRWRTPSLLKVLTRLRYRAIIEDVDVSANNEEYLCLTRGFKRIYRFRITLCDAVVHVQSMRALTHSKHNISASVVRQAGIRYSRRAPGRVLHFN
jgi:hypothetical protein